MSANANGYGHMAHQPQWDTSTPKLIVIELKDLVVGGRMRMLRYHSIQGRGSGRGEVDAGS